MKPMEKSLAKSAAVCECNVSLSIHFLVFRRDCCCKPFYWKPLLDALLDHDHNLRTRARHSRVVLLIPVAQLLNLVAA
jgi:hypothetical protein